MIVRLSDDAQIESDDRLSHMGQAVFALERLFCGEAEWFSDDAGICGDGQ